jgi:aminoglycoside 3-N-acetyltransferase
LLGCDHDSVTFLHHVEHIADIPDKRIARFKVPVLENGARVWRDMEEFDTSGDGAHANWPDRFFSMIVDGYLAASGNNGGPVGDAHCHLFSARGLLDFALPVMVRVAALGHADAILREQVAMLNAVQESVTARVSPARAAERPRPRRS